MTYLRWLYKSWSFFWTFTGILVVTLLLICTVIFGAMQLKPVKYFIATEIEQRFNEQYNGVLEIGEFDGFLPFIYNLKDVRIYSDSTQAEPVFSANQLDARIELFSTFQNKLVVQGMFMENPKFILDGESSFSLQQALSRKQSNNELNQVGDLSSIQVIIPSAEVVEGEVHFRNMFNQQIAGIKTDTLRIQDINLSTFFEFTDEQRFLDISDLKFQIPELDIQKGHLFGQIYNDHQFLEFNAFNLSIGESNLRLSGEANGVDLLQPDVLQQLKNATLVLDVDNISLHPDNIREFVPDFPPLKQYLAGSLSGEGSLDSFWFKNVELTAGESYLFGNGYLINALNNAEIQYGFTLDGAMLAQSEADILFPELNQAQADALTQTHLEGSFEGTIHNISADILASSDRGTLELAGNIDLNTKQAFDFTIQTDSLNIGGIISPQIQHSNISLNGEIRSSSTDYLNSEGGLSITFQEGSFDQRQFDQISILAKWEDGVFDPNVNIRLNGSTFSASGKMDLKSDVNEYSLKGQAKDFEVYEWLKMEGMNPVVADLNFDIFLRGNTVDQLHGQVSVDIPKAIAGSDTLGFHQLYFDFNEPSASNRLLRFTSTAFDATLEGDYIPSTLVSLTDLWSTYFEERVRDEILFQEIQPTDSTQLIVEDQNLNFSGRLKNTNLVQSYFPEFPTISSSTRINSTINASSDRLLFNATIQDPEIDFLDYNVDSLLVQMTGSFRYGQKLKDFGGLQLQVNAANLEYDFIDAQGFEMYAEFNRDSLFLRHNIDYLANSNDFYMETQGNLNEESIKVSISEFNYGQDQYRWSKEGNPSVEINSDEDLTFNEFAFRNADQYIRINGTISDDVQDSVNYEIGGIDLERISNIVDGKLSFGGVFNGVFTTRTLTTVPTIQGDIDIEGFDLNNQLIGDINLRSRYNSELQRFDTNIDVSTDSTKYPQYFANNDRRGQEFDINGYVLAPQNGEFPDSDSLFVFDVDFNNIDMWILPLIGPKIFTEGAGLSGGTGKIWGNTETYDFRADFIVGTDDAVYLRPRFLDTYYYAQGGITFTRDRGMEFNDIFLVDPSGGNAILSGFFDFNDFQPLSYVGITLEMDEFQFLNSTFDASAPFYGNAYGTSTVSISGTNFDPVLRSETPIILSDFSEIGIPLLEETELNENNKFIRFVNTFDIDIDSTQNQFRNRNNTNLGSISEEDVDLSFAERFTLDLQFEANDPMTVQLIFDPVTGDIVTADGTGRMRIRLEDEQVSMFGRFDITGGRYQFVSGDIFSRRFELESGGSIIWEGDPANARLNLNAVYRARPDINTLTTARSEINPENSQRVPVELVLNIGGTITGIENDFYFRLPETFESRQSSTLATQLATLNRDEELKLIQSANFLLMGDFIPVSGTQNSLFGDNLSGSAAVLNPLISSQVISPLLSSQMNSLLNSDLSSLDVDFNLNTYNQVDLGVALRLYNDRLILRREGQITGRQSNIGDIGATYRINRTFAVTAFHRQDPTFGTLSSTEQSQQSQDINGVGVEAKFSFNTWKEFLRKIATPFRKLLGIHEAEDESITENIEG